MSENGLSVTQKSAGLSLLKGDRLAGTVSGTHWCAENLHAEAQGKLTLAMRERKTWELMMLTMSLHHQVKLKTAFQPGRRAGQESASQVPEVSPMPGWLALVTHNTHMWLSYLVSAAWCHQGFLVTQAPFQTISMSTVVCTTDHCQWCAGANWPLRLLI